jgi:hypothetical protein
LVKSRPAKPRKRRPLPTGSDSESYSYDEQGRVKETRRRLFNQDETIETTYNEQGDVAVEITRTLPGINDPDQASPEQNSEAHYTYQYDDHGNWTEKITSNSSSPGARFEPTGTIRRTLTYF